ncbi:MAG: NUDIX domain-containing protein [Candidatus Saccharimonadales bacterium]
MKPIKLAGCVIVDEQERVLLLHRAAGEIGHWELPGGKLEVDETAEAAAVREVAEEIGVQVRLVKALGSCVFDHHGNSYHYSWFHAEIVSGQPQVVENDIHDDLDYLGLDDMMEVALSPNMQILLGKFWSSEVVI